MNDKKRCITCSQDLSIFSFSKDSQTTDGLAKRCRSCCSIKNKNYRQKLALNPKKFVPSNNTCKLCGVNKEISQFAKAISTKTGYRNICKTCAAVESKKWRKQNPEQYKRNLRKAIYKLSDSDYQDMLQRQGNLCAICRQSSPLHIDHCHKSGKVRGLLCQSCNQGLGMFKDDLRRLEAAKTYLATSNNAEISSGV